MRKFLNSIKTARPATVKAETTDDGEAKLTIYGAIFSEDYFGLEVVTPTNISKALDSLGDVKEINIYIDSVGGDAFAGIAIYNILKRHDARIIAHVDGLAASAASIILQGADERIINNGALVMIHNAWTIALGDAVELRDTADKMATLDSALNDIYAERATETTERIAEMMDAETWMSGDDAVKFGFADKRINNKTSLNASASAGIPDDTKQAEAEKQKIEKQKEFNNFMSTHTMQINANALKLMEAEV